MIKVSDTIYNYIESVYGKNAAELFVKFVEREPAQYIRVNPLKTNPEELSKILRENYSIDTEAVPGLPGSLKVLSGSELVGKTVEHIIGDYYIQGLSSMLPPLVLNPGINDIVLDLCAAPGSKTTELAEIMNNLGTLIANEIQLDRVKSLVFNIDRMNIINAGILHSKGELLSKSYSDYFDKILVDAPCSGLGIVQKKEEVSNWWSLERASRLGELQLRLLIAAIKMVKTGGEVVYSTCTLTPEENEFVLNKVLEKYPVELIDIELPVKSRDAFTEYGGVKLNPQIAKARRIFPWDVDSDGFFIAKLRKIGSTTSPEPAHHKSREIKFLDYKSKNINKYLINIPSDFGIPEDVLSGYKYFLKGNDIFFVEKEWSDPNPGMFQRIGTKFGVIDRNGRTVFHTHAAQILEKYISKNIYEISDHDELKIYLEGGIIKKETGIKGQCAIKFNGFIIGTAIITKAGIKSRFPRSKRTQDIHFDF